MDICTYNMPTEPAEGHESVPVKDDLETSPLVSDAASTTIQPEVIPEDDNWDNEDLDVAKPT
jgi:hypothetical protein